MEWRKEGLNWFDSLNKDCSGSAFNQKVNLLLINGSDLVCLEAGRESQIVKIILINKVLDVCCRLEE